MPAVHCQASPLNFQLEEIRQRRKRAVVAVVYCTFGDESRDESKERVYAVAGAFGHQSEWDELEIPWKQRLGGRVFHAADCESDMGEFAVTSHQENLNLYRDLVEIVANSKILGHGIAVNVNDYKRAFPSDFEHTPYLWGFGDVVRAASELAYLSLPSEEVEITFDRNEELECSATEMYRYCLRLRKITTRQNLFGKISFACRRTVGIQVADLFARETMKHLDNHIGPTYRPERLSCIALRKHDKFRFVCYTREHFEGAITAFPPESLPYARMIEYQKWLKELHLEDNLPNRVRHISQFPKLSED